LGGTHFQQGKNPIRGGHLFKGRGGGIKPIIFGRGSGIKSMGKKTTGNSKDGCKTVSNHQEWRLGKKEDNIGEKNGRQAAA